MAFTVEIKNLGKIAGAPIVVGGLTVLAGPNGTGKSFFSKALYSVFDAMNANHALIKIQTAMAGLQPDLRLLEASDLGENPLLASIGANLNRLESMCESLSGRRDEIIALGEMRQDLAKAAGNVVRAYEELRPVIEQLAKSGKIPMSGDPLESMHAGFQSVDEFARLTPEHLAVDGFKRMLDQNLVSNFQTSNLAGLKKDIKQGAFIDIHGVGRVVVRKSELEVDIQPAGLIRLLELRLRECTKAIYLESPFYWKLRDALMGRVMRFLQVPGRVSLNVPKYFTDLNAALTEEYSGEVAFPELFRRLTEEVLRGKIAIAESGRLVFAEAGQPRPFPLPLTSPGMVNLGMLALLIERKIIDKGAFLFVDEPESNLHPKWQAEMVRALFELAQGGVNVVIATHSADIMERLNALVKKNPGAEEMVALNHFSADGVKNGGKEYRKKMGGILKELTDAFSDSYMMSADLS